jgi:dihydrofolate reductase
VSRLPALMIHNGAMAMASTAWSVAVIFFVYFAIDPIERLPELRGHIIRKLVVNTFLTPDGVMQAPGEPEEDPTGGFALGGWSVSHWDDSMGEVMTRSMTQPFELLLDRKTYEIFAAHWPFATEPGADELNAARKYVATTTLASADWNNSTILDGDVVQQVAELKEQDGPGDPSPREFGPDPDPPGQRPDRQVLANDLSHRPSKGKRLFGDGTVPRTFTGRDASTSSTGVVMATYERAGEVETGSFALEDPTDFERERREQLEAEG